MRIFYKDLIKIHEKISETDLKHVINGSNFQPRSHLGPESITILKSEIKKKLFILILGKASMPNCHQHFNQ